MRYALNSIIGKKADKKMLVGDKISWMKERMETGEKKGGDEKQRVRPNGKTSRPQNLAAKGIHRSINQAKWVPTVPQPKI